MGELAERPASATNHGNLQQNGRSSARPYCDRGARAWRHWHTIRGDRSADHRRRIRDLLPVRRIGLDHTRRERTIDDAACSCSDTRTRYSAFHAELRHLRSAVVAASLLAKRCRDCLFWDERGPLVVGSHCEISRGCLELPTDARPGGIMREGAWRLSTWAALPICRAAIDRMV